MAKVLRPYQAQARDRIHRAWQHGAQVVCAVLPTGAGKTVLFSSIIADWPRPVMVMAHRQELVGQISMALADSGVSHGIIAATNTVKWIVRRQAAEYGRPYFSDRSTVTVASVDTLLRRTKACARAIDSTTLWVMDEFHHCLRSNKWGKAVDLFGPDCKGLGVTATPPRADGLGIGRWAHGVADELIVGPSMRELIRGGHLTDYRIFAPETAIDMSRVKVSAATGDFSKPGLVTATRASTIVGDIVGEYCKHAPGKLGVTFTTDVQSAKDIAQAYNAAGVPARAVFAKTPDRERQEAIDMLRRGDLKQLTNVDLFGEGFDLPAIEVVSFGRRTLSYALYVQQFGRALRTAPGKAHAIIIDHVGNVAGPHGHGLPDARTEWDMNDREKKSASQRDPDMVPVRVCQQCTAVYESWEKVCPYCGYTYIPAERSAPEYVDGDLTELGPEILAKMRGEVDRVDKSPQDVREEMLRAGAPAIVAASAGKQHRLRQTAQTVLRAMIAQWAGMFPGATDRELYQRFYRKYGTDVMTAQAMGRPDAEKLTKELWNDIKRMGA